MLKTRTEELTESTYMGEYIMDRKDIREKEDSALEVTKAQKWKSWVKNLVAAAIGAIAAVLWMHADDVKDAACSLLDEDTAVHAE